MTRNAATRFALSFTPDAVHLLDCRDAAALSEGAGSDAARLWHERETARFDDADFRGAMSRLRREAVADNPVAPHASASPAGNGDAKVGDDGAPVALIIPDEQILYTTLDLPEDEGDDLSSRLGGVLEGLTPYSAQELAWDWRTLADGRVRVAAVARQTLLEAEEFARRHGFVAAGFLATPAQDEFPGQPRFLTAAPVQPEATEIPAPALAEPVAVPATEAVKADAAMATDGQAASAPDPVPATEAVEGDVGGVDDTIIAAAALPDPASDTADAAPETKAETEAEVDVEAAPETEAAPEAEAAPVSPLETPEQGAPEATAVDKAVIRPVMPPAPAPAPALAPAATPAAAASPRAEPAAAESPAQLKLVAGGSAAAASAALAHAHVTARHPDGADALSPAPRAPLPAPEASVETGSDAAEYLDRPAATREPRPLPDRAQAVLDRAAQARTLRVEAPEAELRRPGQRGGVGGLVAMTGALVIGLALIWGLAPERVPAPQSGPASEPLGGAEPAAPPAVTTAPAPAPTSSAPPAVTPAVTPPASVVSAPTTPAAGTSPLAGAPVVGPAAPAVAPDTQATAEPVTGGAATNLAPGATAPVTGADENAPSRAMIEGAIDEAVRSAPVAGSGSGPGPASAPAVSRPSPVGAAPAGDSAPTAAKPAESAPRPSRPARPPHGPNQRRRQPRRGQNPQRAVRQL